MSFSVSIADFSVFAAEAFILDKTKCGVFSMDGFENNTFFRTDTVYEFIFIED